MLIETQDKPHAHYAVLREDLNKVARQVGTAAFTACLTAEKALEACGTADDVQAHCALIESESCAESASEAARNAAHLAAELIDRANTLPPPPLQLDLS